MSFKSKLIDGILSYVYYKIAKDGQFKLRIPEDFLQHVFKPFLSYYTSQVSVEVHEGRIVINGASLVPVNVELKNPVIRDKEILIPLKMNKVLSTFISTFGKDKIKPLKIEQDNLVIPSELIYSALKDIPDDLKISRINIKEGEIEIDVVSRK